MKFLRFSSIFFKFYIYVHFLSQIHLFRNKIMNINYFKLLIVQESSSIVFIVVIHNFILIQLGVSANHQVEKKIKLFSCSYEIK